MQNHKYTLQSQCTHPNDTYRRAYILNKRKLGTYTQPRTPNWGFHPIRMIPHPPQSLRTHVHDHKLSIVKSNTDTRARGANDESPPQANTPLPGRTPGRIRSPPPSPIRVHYSIEQFFLLFISFTPTTCLTYIDIKLCPDSHITCHHRLLPIDPPYVWTNAQTSIGFTNSIVEWRDQLNSRVES